MNHTQRKRNKSWLNVNERWKAKIVVRAVALLRYGDEALPLYQNTVPKSCGPLDILHTKFISLPVLTYKSDGPNKIALNSVRKRKEEQDEAYFNLLRHMVYSCVAFLMRMGWWGIVCYVKNQLCSITKKKERERECVGLGQRAKWRNDGKKTMESEPVKLTK